MECSEARKKLKEYAVDAIKNRDEIYAIEAHVSGCEVCKRELLLWQEVTEKRAAIKKMQAKMPVALSDRIKYRMLKNDKQADMPPMLKKLGLFAGNKGVMIVTLALIMGALVFIIMNAPSFYQKLFGPVLIFCGFAVLFLLVLFRGKRP